VTASNRARAVTALNGAADGHGRTVTVLNGAVALIRAATRAVVSSVGISSAVDWDSGSCCSY